MLLHIVDVVNAPWDPNDASPVPTWTSCGTVTGPSLVYNYNSTSTSHGPLVTADLKLRVYMVGSGITLICENANTSSTKLRRKGLIAIPIVSACSSYADAQAYIQNVVSYFNGLIDVYDYSGESETISFQANCPIQIKPIVPTGLTDVQVRLTTEDTRILFTGTRVSASTLWSDAPSDVKYMKLDRGGGDGFSAVAMMKRSSSFDAYFIPMLVNMQTISDSQLYVPYVAPTGVMSVLQLIKSVLATAGGETPEISALQDAVGAVNAKADSNEAAIAALSSTVEAQSASVATIETSLATGGAIAAAIATAAATAATASSKADANAEDISALKERIDDHSNYIPRV